MTVSEERIEDDLSWKRRVVELTEEMLDEGSVAEDRIRSSHRTLGNAARGIGIDELLLYGETSGQHFQDGARELIDTLAGSEQDPDRPLHCRDALYTAALSGDESVLKRAAERTVETNESFQSHPLFASVYHHVVSLSWYLLGDEARARAGLDGIEATDDDDAELTDVFVGRRTCLRGLLDRDAKTATDGLSTLLRSHHRRKGDDPEGADHFVSLDASVYLLLAKRAGLDIDPQSFDKELCDYLLTPPWA